MYFNTTNASGVTLSEYRRKAETQDEIVMGLFVRFDCPLSPSFVLKHALSEAPITSVRRSITNLTNEGKLVKTGIRTKGIYGRMEYCWRLSDPTQGELL